MSSNIKVPAREKSGSLKLNASDAQNRYLEDVVDDITITIQNGKLSSRSESGNYRPHKVVFSEDLATNKQIIHYKSTDLSQTYLTAEFLFNNLIGAAILMQIKIDDFSLSLRTTLDYAYANDYADVVVSKTKQDI